MPKFILLKNSFSIGLVSGHCRDLVEFRDGQKIAANGAHDWEYFNIDGTEMHLTTPIP
ncbi:MAG: hypothetical protein GY754_44500 [bacterium]|nr:hypothetical protein [bacterium]